MSTGIDGRKECIRSLIKQHHVLDLLCFRTQYVGISFAHLDQFATAWVFFLSQSLIPAIICVSLG